MKNAREVSLDVLNAVIYKGAYSNIALNLNLNKNNLNNKDKGLVTEIVYGTLKYKLSIDKIIESFVKDIKKIDKSILNILRLTIYQIRYLDKIPEFAAVNEGVNLSKKIQFRQSKFVNAVIRNYIRTGKDKEYYKKDDKVDYLGFKYSFPNWMVKLFINQYGENITEDILKGLNEKPDVTVRVNSQKIDFDEAFDKLKEHEYNVEEGYVCPEAIKIIKGQNIEQNPLFKNGYITVQDESAMLVAPSMDVDENLVSFDLCSAPGGKTTHIAECANNTGKVLAFDVHENKLSLIKQNKDRLGITNIIEKQMDATIYNDNLKEKADRVLIDVPCSGLGIIRKKPEIKWSKTKKELNDIVKIQRQIMKNAAKYLKRDGVLIYSTCTLNKEENEKNIEWFLKENKNFKIEKLYYGDLENMMYHDRGYVTILPNEHMDGFFIAKLTKC